MTFSGVTPTLDSCCCHHLSLLCTVNSRALHIHVPSNAIYHCHCQYHHRTIPVLSDHPLRLTGINSCFVWSPHGTTSTLCCTVDHAYSTLPYTIHVHVGSQNMLHVHVRTLCFFGMKYAGDCQYAHAYHQLFLQS